MIYVFKTSVNTQSAVSLLRLPLDGYAPIIRWNFDLEDCDRILRIESDQTEPEFIIELLQDHGFECEELAD